MELIIELKSNELLDQFRQYVYDQDSELVLFEHYDYTPGFNKEPVVVAVIAALGGPVVMYQITKIIQSFLNYYKEKNKDTIEGKLKTDKQKQDFIKDLFSLKIKNAESVKSISTEDFTNCEFDDLKKFLE
jgi:hypothetical protein